MKFFEYCKEKLENVEIVEVEEEARDALHIMCARCSNHAMCGGTGCQPKKELEKTIDYAEYTRNWHRVAVECIEKAKAMDDDLVL